MLHIDGFSLLVGLGGEVLVYVWFIWEDCKCEYRAFAGKAPLMLPNKDKAPVLPSSPPNESALVTGSEDDPDANETVPRC